MSDLCKIKINVRGLEAETSEQGLNQFEIIFIESVNVSKWLINREGF